jgi:hypothetical protein
MEEVFAAYEDGCYNINCCVDGGIRVVDKITVGQ